MKEEVVFDIKKVKTKGDTIKATIHSKGVDHEIELPKGEKGFIDTYEIEDPIGEHLIRDALTDYLKTKGVDIEKEEIVNDDVVAELFKDFEHQLYNAIDNKILEDKEKKQKKDKGYGMSM